VPPEDIASVLRKRAKIDMRVSEQEKLEIQQMAERLGVTVTEYLLKLHKKEMRKGQNRERPFQAAHR
jgi:predicted ArsR family transcriptional regulator